MAGQTACQSSSTSGGSHLLARIGGGDESALHSCLSHVAHSFSHGRVLEHVLVELVLDHLDYLRVLLSVADLYRLMLAHFDEPPQFMRDLQHALLLQTFEDRVHQGVPARFVIRPAF